MPEQKKSHIIINIIVRTVLGLGIIYFMNQYLAYRGIGVAVGMNTVTALTSGILGLPGVALLYGILFYQNL